jgi:hypothetical protein
MIQAAYRRTAPDPGNHTLGPAAPLQLYAGARRADMRSGPKCAFGLTLADPKAHSGRWGGVG